VLVVGGGDGGNMSMWSEDGEIGRIISPVIGAGGKAEEEGGEEVRVRQCLQLLLALTTSHAHASRIAQHTI